MLRFYLSLGCFFIASAVFAAGSNRGIGVSIDAAIRAQSGPVPTIISTLPADGSTTTTAAPKLELVFSIDMDVSRTGTDRLFLPSGMTIKQLVWKDPRTLDVFYDGAMDSLGAKRIALADKYFLSVGQVSLPLGSGYAFFLGGAATTITASATAVPPAVAIGSDVSFNATAVDSSGAPINYSWDFGDNTRASGQSGTHAYVAPGNYTAILTADNGHGGTAQSSLAILVGVAPGISSTTPMDGGANGASTPPIRFVFNSDMDTSRTDLRNVLLPDDLAPTSLHWADNRTLDIQYTGELDSFGAKRVALADGTITNTAKISLPPKSGLAFNYQNSPPVISATPTFAPPTVAAGAPVVFTASATDPDNDPLSYTWNFGDGNFGTGATISHTYVNGGNYSVLVQVTDGKGGTAFSTFYYPVTGGVGGGAQASGNSSWIVTQVKLSVVLAGAKGKSAGGGSSGGGGGGGVGLGGVGVSTPQKGRDKISVSGIIELPANFDPSGKAVQVSIGALSASFTFDGKGMGKNGSNSIKMTRKLDKNIFRGGAVKITYALSGTFADALAKSGLGNATTPKTGSDVALSTSISLLGNQYNTSVPLVWIATANKTGKATRSTAVK